MNQQMTGPLEQRVRLILYLLAPLGERARASSIAWRRNLTFIVASNFRFRTRPRILRVNNQSYISMCSRGSNTYGRRTSCLKTSAVSSTVRHCQWSSQRGMAGIWSHNKHGVKNFAVKFILVCDIFEVREDSAAH
jgi:hypothetical protein